MLYQNSKYLIEAKTQTLWRIASGTALQETLDELAHILQASSPGLRIAILTVNYDPEGVRLPQLGFGSAPSMGESYAVEVEGTQLIPGNSPSADVVLTGEPIFVQNGEADERISVAVKEIYRRHGIRACYLAPLKDPQTQAIIGVFCMYPVKSGPPTAEETQLLYLGAELSALAISRHNLEVARKRSEAALGHLLSGLRRQAMTDPLTGLPNRAQFLQTLSQILQVADGHEKALRPAILFIDLDRFKLVNDTMGHAAGDLLLKEMSQRFVATINNTDIVARLGGDEFVILLVQTEPIAALNIARQIRAIASKPVLIEGQEAFVAGSVGVALWNPEENITADALLKNADTAMYHAKEEGGNGVALYTDSMGDHVRDKATLEADLRRAILHQELSLAFQPQFDLVTGRMIGVEALVRWQHIRRGWVSPAEFIPVAEESGLIEPLGEWVLREACRHAVNWCRLARPLRLAVNLSARQFTPRNRLAEQVERVLAETGFSPPLLDLEITESVLLTKNAPVSETLAAIKHLGVRLLLDDFGTGYGSLLYLRQFPLDVLKVDSSFVQGLSQSREDAAIVRAVIDLAHALGMRVIAEGVETSDQLAELSLLGCDALQGYLLSRPLPGDEILKLLHEKTADMFPVL